MARRFLRTAGVAGVAVATTATVTPAATSSPHPGTATPIRHVIVIIGENHSFGNVFATYQPPHGQHIGNLLSEWIVTRGGDPARSSPRRPSSRPPTQRSTA
jgi:phospholipase C